MRSAALLLLTIAATYAGARCLVVFVDAMWWPPNVQDLWDVSRFAFWLVGSVVAAFVAAIAGQLVRERELEAFAERMRSTSRLRRVSAETVSSAVAGASALAVFAARALLVLTVGVLLYCNVGPLRTVVHSIVWRVGMYGMARDLPPPPPPAVSPG